MQKETTIVNLKTSGVNDTVTGVALITEDEKGNRDTVPLWYDRKFYNVGLRLGDVVRIFKNGSGNWSLKSLVKKAEGVETLDIDKNFFPPYHPPVDKVAALLKP